MNETLLLSAFFLVVMIGVTLAAHVLMNRNGQLDARKIMVDVAARVGQAVPERERKVDQTRRRLILAGYRQESACAVFQGIRTGVAGLSAGLEVAGLRAGGVRARESRAAAPLSYPQQRLWFLEQLDPGRSSAA